MWCTIFDPRIVACVASGCMNTFRERSQKLSSCGIQYPFGLLQYGDVPELFSLIAPRPLCTDNAAMVASLAYYKYRAGEFADLDLEAKATS